MDTLNKILNTRKKINNVPDRNNLDEKVVYNLCVGEFIRYDWVENGKWTGYFGLKSKNK